MKITWKEVVHKLFLFAGEFDYLASLPDMCPPGEILEIGGGYGNSSVALAQSGRPMTTVDVQIRIEFWNNIHKFKLENVKGLNKKSFQVLQDWDRPLALAFIDGDHDPGAVATDCGFAKFIIPQGIIAFHDYHPIAGLEEKQLWPGVKHDVDAYMAEHPEFEPIASVGSIQAFRRVA